MTSVMTTEKRFSGIVVALILAATIGAGCGDGGNGDGDDDGNPDTLVAVQFSDGVNARGSRELWGDELQSRIDSGVITCEPESDNKQICESGASFKLSGGWVPAGIKTQP